MLKINMNFYYILIFFEGSFSGNDVYSRVGYVILSTDRKDNGNIIYSWSSKFGRLARSVLAAKSFGMANDCDAALVIKHDLTKILNKIHKMKTLADIETLYNVSISTQVTSNASQTKRKLMSILRPPKKHKVNELSLTSCGSHDSTYNITDAMSKHTIWT